MTDDYSDYKCECGGDLFQCSGDWVCPECDNVDPFTLDKNEDRDSFEI